MQSVSRSYSLRSRFFPSYSELEIQRRTYTIEAHHHYTPPTTMPMYQLLYKSSMLLKDLKDAQKAREKAHKEAEAAAARAQAQARNAARRVYVRRK